MRGDFDEDEDDDDYEPEFDCHQTPDGGCELAGSEECEFDCPYGKPWENDEDDED